MILLDSNILIYAAQEEYAYLRPLISDPINTVSALSLVEVLGYHGLTDRDRSFFEAVFQVLRILPIDQEVLNQATLLRQKKNIGTADAIIAATALVYSCDLNTRNLADFNWILDLSLVNPIP